MGAIRHYLDRIIRPKDKDKEIKGMKALIMDRETKAIVSMVYTMHEILDKDIFHVGTIDKVQEPMLHIKALVLVRPTLENLKALREELAAPKFGSYYLYFTNTVKADFLQHLAEADTQQVVQQVQEVYADFYAVNSNLFHLNLGGSLALSLPRGRWSAAEGHLFERTAQGLAATLLAFKVRPFIRHQRTAVAASLAREVNSTMTGERELFSFKRPAGTPMLLVLDRQEDPVTPLLSQWTYQAMLHELVGISANRVSLADAKAGGKAKVRELPVGPLVDDFYQTHMYANYGDLGRAVNKLLGEYQALRASTAENITTIEDMQRFVDNYPELRRHDNVTGKHVALLGEMSRLVDAHALFEVSEVEQTVACSSAPSEHFSAIMELLGRGDVQQLDALRMVMLFALRYESGEGRRISELKSQLISAKGLRPGDVALIDVLLKYGGSGTRVGDLFGDKSFFSRMSASVTAGFKGVENVFTQHVTPLKGVLDNLVAGTLSKSEYPSVGGEPPRGALGTIIVFVVGGVTFEEAAAVAALNANLAKAAAPGTTAPRIILGGTAVHNSKSFLAELARLGGAVAATPEHVTVSVSGGADAGAAGLGDW